MGGWWMERGEGGALVGLSEEKKADMLCCCAPLGCWPVADEVLVMCSLCMCCATAVKRCCCCCEASLGKNVEDDEDETSRSGVGG